MPYALIAGVVVGKPAVEHFPATGRPRALSTVRCDNVAGEIYHVIGFDDQVGELEVLQPGDSVAIQGVIELDASRFSI